MNAFSLIASGERTLFRRQEVIRDQRNFWGEFRLSLHGQNELASRVFPLKWHKHTKQATYTHWYENGITSMDNRTLAISHHAQTSTLLSSSSSSCTDNKLNLLLFPSTTKFWLAWEKTQTKKKLFTLKNVMGGWIRDNLYYKSNRILFRSHLFWGHFPGEHWSTDQPEFIFCVQISRVFKVSKSEKFLSRLAKASERPDNILYI